MKNFYLTTVALFILVFSTTNIYAQLLPTDDLRNENLGCNSNNYTIFEVFLADVNGNELGDCSPGQTVNAYLWVKYESNANSTVSAFTVFSDLITNYQDGSPSTTNFYQECIDELVSSNSSTNEVLIAPISWNCGDELILSNTTLGWITSGSGVNCDNVQIEDYNKAQCENVGDILVSAPLVTNFIYETNCTSDFTIDFTSTTTGGLVANAIDDLIPNPYIYTWDWGHNGAGTGPVEGPTVPMPSDAVFSHTFPGAGTYYVTLTVRDTDTPFSENTTIPMEVIVAAALSIDEIHTNPSCYNGSNGSIDITVTGGLAPYTYDWDNDGFEDPDNDSEDLTNLSAGTYTVIVTDANGCTVQKTIVLLNGDNTPPTASNPQPIHVQCIGDVPDPNVLVVTDENDNSGINPVVIWVSDVSNGLSCPETITRTYSVTDDCNNQILVTQSIIVNDTTNPTASNPQPINVQCIEDVPNQNINVVTDASDNCLIAPVVLWVSDDSDGLSCPETITRTYSVTDDCNNQILVTQSIIIRDTIAPDTSNCTLANTVLECTDNNETAADEWNTNNITIIEACATDNCDINLTITSDYDFDNLNTTCGPCGTLSVNYIITDDCGNSSNLNVILSFDDITIPDLSDCNVNDLTLECSGNNNEALADQWNLDNITALKSCADDLNITVSSNYTYDNLVISCGLGGTIPVTYTVTDDCNNSATLNVSLTFEDTTPPDLINCTVTDETIECSGTNNEAIADQWNTNNITALENCSTDTCDINFNGQVSSDYSFSNLNTTCGQGGTITVIYTITDDCGNTSTHNATLILSDTTPPDLVNCTVIDETIECAGEDNESIADAWNIANITALETCGTDSCDIDNTFVVTSDYTFANLSGTCGAGGTITIVYTVSDNCNNSQQLTATLTLEDTTPPELGNCTVTDETIECAGEDNEAIADAWNIANITTLETCGTDSCDIDNTFVVTSDYAFTNLNETCGLGGTITVIYTITDDCNNSQQLTVKLNLEDTSPPELGNCTVTNTTVECSADGNEAIADQWNANNISALQTCATDNCDSDNSFVVTSDYDFENLNVSCGPCGSITVDYSISDDCGNETKLTATLTLSDGTNPDLTNCDVVDTTIECSGADNETVANQWNADNITALENCAEDIAITITSDYAFTNLSSTCGAGGSITVNYTATDDCGNPATLTAVLTLEDTTPPDLGNCAVLDTTLECAGEENETIANQWNTDNITTLQTCGTDTCDIDNTYVVTSDYEFTNLSTTCGVGGTIVVNYTVTDDCNNIQTLTATLTLEDTTAPIITSEGSDGNAECTGTNPSLNQEYIEWINDFAGVIVSDNCSSATLSIIEGEWVSDGCTNTITITVIATDDCGLQTSTQEKIFTISDTTAPELISDLVDTTFICNELPPVPVLQIEELCSEDTNIVFTETTEGTEGFDDYKVIRTWVLTDDCGNETIEEQILLVDPFCDCLDDMLISKAITPNGDIYNDYFEVEGIDDCGIPNLKMFNRWGNLVFQSANYDSKKGRWRGTSGGGVTIGGDNKLPTGTYYYIIEFRNSGVRPITGHVYLSTK